MRDIIDIFLRQDAAQTILLLTLISVVGLALGRIKIGSVRLGGGFVFFTAILAGHLAGKAGIAVNAPMMDIAKNFGLVIFVYTLGLQCGPGFFSSMRKGGGKLLFSVSMVILLGTLMTVGLILWSPMGAPESVGLLSGAATNTASMIAAQQTVLDIDPSAVQTSHDVASAYAVAYPFSILAGILCMMLLKAVFKRSAARSAGRGSDEFTEVQTVLVTNPAVFGRQVQEVVSSSQFNFVISRIWHEGIVHIPLSDTVIADGDRLMIICNKDDRASLARFFGCAEDKDWNLPDIDWDIIDKNLVSHHVSVTKADVVGKELGTLHLRNRFGVNITRINRAGFTLVPSAATTLQFGDRLTVVGDEEKIKAMGKFVGNEEKRLNSPRLIPILAGIFLGVLLGSVPIALPGLSSPMKFGIAGGPIIIGILLGAFGPRLHIQTFTTRAALLMLREMGITFFFAALGFGVGGTFVETVFCAQGLRWIGLSVALAAIPVLIMGFVNEKILHLDFAKSAGALCCSVSNSNAMNFISGELESDVPAEVYATVYPVVIFLRVFIAQILLIIFGI